MDNFAQWIASIQEYFLASGIAAAAAAMIASLIGAVVSLKELKLAGLESARARRDAKVGNQVPPLQPSNAEREPFETTALAKYYNQALLSATVSFWFSLVFASVGFIAILFAFATYSKDDPAGTFIKFLGGGIIDAVSALFFVQSNRARKSMSEFFEKLRLDRLNAEARGMIDDIADQERKDQLRMQLILKYSEIDTLVVGG